MITKNTTLIEASHENHQVEQVLMSLGIGYGLFNANDRLTVEEACIKHGLNLEMVLRELNFNRYY